ncbi:MAG: nucleotidyltransferase domain-containing protein [Candidatus Hydrothermarchaeales archaeon]
MDLQKKVTEEFVKNVKEKYGDKIEEIILFGSHAREDYNEESDIDLLVITREDRFKVQKDLSGIAVDILLDKGVYISPKAISTEEYEFMKKINTGFYQNITREGVAIG